MLRAQRFWETNSMWIFRWKTDNLGNFGWSACPYALC